MRASALSVMAVVAVVAWSATAHASEPRVGAADSHVGYARVVDRARDRALRQVLARYDAELARNPRDDVAAVERCRLYDAVLGSGDAVLGSSDAAPPDDPGAACRRELGVRFAASPRALTYRLEWLRGDARRDFLVALLARDDVPWSEAERASLHRALALAYDRRGETTEATAHAHAALALDPSLDSSLALSLIIGRELWAQGRPTEAIVQLSRPTRDGEDAMQERGRLLGAAGAPLRALAIADTHNTSWAELGTLYEKAGKLGQARAADTLIPDVAARRTALARLFARALAGSDAPVADRIYQSLRDLGWRADPYGGYRLALLRRFPSLPWRARDAGGLALFALAILVIFLSPALWIVPLHYWSLWRRVHRAARLPPPRLVTRWRLPQLWLGCAALLVAQLIAYVIFAYADATAIWWHGANDALPHVPRELARLGLCVVLGECALLLAFVVRRRDLRLFGPGRWTVGRSLARAALTLVALLALNAALTWLVHARGPAGASTVTIEQLVYALRTTYGLAVVVLLICVLGPIAEELVFRSLLLDVLTRSLPFWSANVLQALAFAAAHGELKKIPYLFAVGFVCGLLRGRSGGLFACIVFHMLNNAFATVAALHVGVAPPAPRPVAPAPSLAASAALLRCVARAPTPKDAAASTGLPAAAVLNEYAWRIALDANATPACLRLAADAIDRALAALPERPALLDTEATVFYRLGRVDEAIDLERATLERFQGGAEYYAQLGRFLRARRPRTPLVLGTAGARDVRLALVADKAGPALQLDLARELPDGVALYFQVFGENTKPALLRVQLGPAPQPRSFRFPLVAANFALDPATNVFTLALIDSRGCEGCAAGDWYWSLQFPGTAVDGYP